MRIAVVSLVVAVAAALALASAPPSAAAPKAHYEPGVVLVRFAVRADAARLVAKLGDSVAGTTANGVSVVRLRRTPSVPAAVALYRKLPGVRFAEPNFFAHAALVSPNDSSFGNQWALSKVQATAGWGVFPGSYAAGGGVRIGIVDTGVDATHSDLDDGRVRTDLAGNCLSSTGCATGSAADDNGHGTHVAGIAAAETNNANGVAGLAYQSQVIPVKVLDSTGTGTYAAIANGIAWAADHGARVVNLSIAGTDPSQTLCNAVSSAIARGVVVVVAAGNDGTSAAHYPAACSGAIGVAATTSSDARASFSDTGSPNVFVAAPGDQILSTYAGGGYTTMSGTSMAAPLVAGLAALLVAEAPGRSVADVKRVLATTSDKVGSGYGTDPYGTCSGCTWSSSFGYGRINVYRALSQTPPQPDFGLTATPGVAAAPLGGAATADVSVEAFSGFNGTVTLSASGLPAGATAVFAPATVAAPSTSHVVILVPPTAPSGSYVVTITGTSGTLTRTATISLSVTGVTVALPPAPGTTTTTSAPPIPAASVGAPDFTIEVIPGQRAVTHGYATEFLLRTTASGTLTAPITLSVSGLPAGAIGTFAPPALVAPGEGALAIATLLSTPPGTYTLTVTATAGSITHTATGTLVVA